MQRPLQGLEQHSPDLPTNFATIHLRSDNRPAGYTAYEIVALNELANQPRKTPA